MNIKEKAEEFLYKYCEERTVDNVIEVIILFAKEMCELQKIKCADNATSDWNYKNVIDDGYETSYTDICSYVEKDSILNTKNVCDE